jgi:hypothetical protein
VARSVHTFRIADRTLSEPFEGSHLPVHVGDQEGRVFEGAVARVAEILRERSVREIVYLHCDHFEPWRNVFGTVSAANAEEIGRFFEVTRSIDFARRLTLFYRPHLKPTMTAEEGAVFASDTPLGFVRPSEAAVAIARSGIGRIGTASEHELQLHIHHEYVTRNDKYCHQSKWGSRFFTEEDTSEMDRRRFCLLLDLSLETVARETGEPLTDWFFIHGNWALNGSDRNVCTIDDEILVLQSRGCRGDFSFPAEPPHASANPVTYAEPSFVAPFKGAKCYDAPEADRRAAWGAAELAADPTRFFVWAAQPDAYAHVSLDYPRPWVQALCAEPGHWAELMAERALVRDACLYVNTYAHSMSLKNLAHEQFVFPHDYGPIRSMLGVLFGAAEAVGAAPAFLTASETYAKIAGAGVRGVTR